jgi:hypothetical protein
MWTRTIAMIGPVGAAALGIADLVAERVIAGIVLLVLSGLATLAWWRGGSGGERAKQHAARIHAIVFFGLCGLAGTAVFVLAVVGVMREPAFYAPIGAVAALGSAFVLVEDANSEVSCTRRGGK